MIQAGMGGGGNEGKVVRNEEGRKTQERIRPRRKYGGGINQNVGITARCLNFEKGSI